MKTNLTLLFILLFGLNLTLKAQITLSNVHDTTIVAKVIKGGNTPCISLTNCYNVQVIGCTLYSGADRGIYLYNCHNITIDNCIFADLSAGIVADHCGNSIHITNNSFTNMNGPMPRGQAVQFNSTIGSGNEVTGNKINNNGLAGNMPEDCISMYKSSGTPQSPIIIDGNYINGGFSASGSGIMLGDNGGSYQTAEDNVCINTGNAGIAISGGDHMSLINNRVFSSKNGVSNVGVYLNPYSASPITNATVQGNIVNWTNKGGAKNGYWLGSGVTIPNGWNTNNFNDNTLTASIR